MAYENGQQINRHANIKDHKRKLRKRFSKWLFCSHENYEQNYDKFHERLDDLYGVSEMEQKRRDNGWKPYYKRYWRLRNDDTKKNLKRHQHRATRRYYKNQLSNMDIEDGIDRVPDNRLEDAWRWLD